MSDEPEPMNVDLVDLTVHNDVDNLLGHLEAANATRSNDAGRVWFVQHGRGDGVPVLYVGLRGDIGALTWADATSVEIPEGGTGTGEIDYFVWSGHHMGLSAASEMPKPVVYRAVREFAATAQRPTCVNWIAEPEL